MKKYYKAIVLILDILFVFFGIEMFSVPNTFINILGVLVLGFLATVTFNVFEMKKYFGFFLFAFALLVSTTSCGYTRIEAGHVGIKVNLYGDDKGVDQVAEVTGAQWYNPIRTQIFEFPTFVQNAVWTSDTRESNDTDEGFKLTTADGLEVQLDVSLNYRVNPENAIDIFKKFRKPLDEVSATVLRNYTRDGYNEAASYFTAEQIYSERQRFKQLADSFAIRTLEKEGFTVEKIVLLNSIRLPASVQKNIEDKINARQLALKKEMELEQATADANKRIEEARGRAESMKIEADAERYAYEQKQKALTTLLVQQQFLDKWDGSYGTGNVFGDGPLLYKNIK